MSQVHMKSGRTDSAGMRSGWRVRRWMGRVAVCLALFVTAGQVSAQTVEYIHADALGSPVAVTNAAGAVVERQVYEPYGAGLTRGPNDGPGFTGHVEDFATGLTYMQQRYYDALVGRFLSADPIASRDSLSEGFNRYWYASANPYKNIDPNGGQVLALYSNESRALFAMDIVTRAAVFASAESGGKPWGDPIPAGEYSILTRRGRDGFYRLERRDSNFGDDETPEGRTNLRLHGPGRTLGCVEVCEPDKFAAVDNLIRKTETSSTPVNDNSIVGRIAGRKETVANFGRLTALPSGVSLNMNMKSGEVSLSWRVTGSKITQYKTVCNLKDGACQ